MLRFARLAPLALLVTACAPATRSPKDPAFREQTEVVATPQARPEPPLSGAPGAPLAWADLNAETFARARAEKRYVLLDGSAEWCHWCHVMEATTYHDEEVRKVLDARFIAVKVDVDARPDVLERYADWGWPATVLFSPDGAELGKYRGYLAPDEMKQILAQVVASGVAERGTAAVPPPPAAAPKKALDEKELAAMRAYAEAALERLYDPREGGWGAHQKAPMGWDNAWTLLLAERGDANARQRAVFTLDKQAALIDPVWGGIYQYSAAADWNAPHFEKLMTFQAPAIENYAVAYRLTHEPRMLARAKAVQSFVARFMTSPEGGFYATQDADVNAHDRDKPFLDGHVYYALDEKARLARGLPRVDTHEYGRENGLAIGAHVALFEATGDATARATAERAATRILVTHLPKGATKKAGISHDVLEGDKPAKQLYLSDNAAFGWGLMRLFEATKDARWKDAAVRIADFLLADLMDDASGGLFAATVDPDAVGVFAARRVPFEDNVMALRMLAKVARATKDPRYARAVDRVLRAVSTKAEIDDRGRMLGDYLLALEETKDVRGVLR